MDDRQRHNLAEIEGLNQRGGRTLSLVDLIRAGTMTEEMVAYCWTAIARGASFLTAARPGGAGKSTVLANLLALLPPGEEIVTFGGDASVSSPGTPDRNVGRTNGKRLCSLAHEIGSGRWYGYIWGAQVREFLALKSPGHRLAACLHADTLDELTAILTAPPLSCSSAQVRAFDLLLFIHVLPEGRRVVAVNEASADGYREVMQWRPAEGAWSVNLGATDFEEYHRRLRAVRGIIAAGEAEFGAVRERVLAEYCGP